MSHSVDPPSFCVECFLYFVVVCVLVLRYCELCVMYVSFWSKIRPRSFLVRCHMYFLAAPRACMSRCDGDVICVGHDLNRCSGWWYVE